MWLVRPKIDKEGALEDIRIRKMHMLEADSGEAHMFSCALPEIEGKKDLSPVSGRIISEGALC